MRRRSPLSRVAGAALTVGLVSAAGCLPSPPPGSPGGDELRPRTATVRVVNEGLDPVRITVKSGAWQRELGAVEPRQGRSFVIPPAMLASGSVHLHADPVGGARPYRSPALPLLVGQMVEWELQSLPGQAFIHVYGPFQ